MESSRNGCMLHGALQTALEIEGVVPIIHSNSGCGIQQYLSGASGLGYIDGFAVPSSNVIEKQIIFGGTSRLREQIKNTVKIVKGSLYLVLTGCSTELVGDDVNSMTREAQEQGYPVIYIKTPGFKGQSHFGYEALVKGIIEQLSKLGTIDESKDEKSINIFGILPKQDPYWKGNLEELRKIIETFDIKVNTFLGFNQGIEQWKEIPSAGLNIIFSPWALEAAEYLQKKYGTPFLKFYSLPVGLESTKYFIEEITKKLNIKEEDINKFISNEQKQFKYYLKSVLDLYFDYNFQKTYAFIGEGNAVIGISEFLTKTLGLIPEVLIITDSFSDRVKECYEEELKEFCQGEKFKFYFTEDRGEIQDILLNSTVELIFGSALEKEIAEKMQIPIHVISYPMVDNIILNKTNIGFYGAITLLEDISSTILEFEKNKKIMINNEIEKLLGI